MNNVTHIASHRKFKSNADRAFERFLKAWTNGLITTDPGPVTLEPLVYNPKEGKFLKLETKHVE